MSGGSVPDDPTLADLDDLHAASQRVFGVQASGVAASSYETFSWRRSRRGALP